MLYHGRCFRVRSLELSHDKNSGLNGQDLGQKPASVLASARTRQHIVDIGNESQVGQQVLLRISAR
jgi:hypothetical protein